MHEERNAASSLDADIRAVRDDELESVSGGKSEPGDLVFVHKIDKASPVLL
jgi:hypothetical protein